MHLGEEIIQFIRTKTEEANQEDFYRQPLVGFSSASDPLYTTIKKTVGPHHLDPADILPEVKTLVSFFLPFSKKIVKANRREPDIPAREWMDSYTQANNLINLISQGLVDLMIFKGFKAALVGPTQHYDEKDDENTLKAPWSHRSAAFVAGLGRFGLNRLLITPVGGAGRYGTVFISEEITPSVRPAEELCLFWKNGSCRHCLEHCPVRALGGGPDEFDRKTCKRQLLAMASQASNLNRTQVCGKCAVGPCAIFEAGENFPQ
jgi:epoxyqueuosine reductase QueG